MAIAQIDRFDGYKLIEDMKMTEADTVTVNKTWRERLFSWPWDPRVLTKDVEIQKPRTTLHVDHVNRLMVAHPATMATLRETIRRSEQ